MLQEHGFTAFIGYSCLPTKGGQAELAWVPGYIPRQFAHPKTADDPGTNWTWCGVTLLVKTSALPLSQTNS